MDYLSSFNLYLLIQPLSVAAALSPTFGRATSGASVEASQAVLVQAVAEVHATENQQALAVIHLTLCWNNLSVRSSACGFGEQIEIEGGEIIHNKHAGKAYGLLSPCHPYDILQK